ncbi:hypothetical protein DFH28DRAFT_1172513 [Melampsora americana]|nr:hypothetical protein DFH28DRAFT_1172513 [Melampsora americana]
MKLASWIPLIIASIAFSIKGLPSAYKSSLLEIPDEAQDTMSWAHIDPMLGPVKGTDDIRGAAEPGKSKQQPCQILSKRASNSLSSEAILSKCLENRAKSTIRARIDDQKETQQLKNYGKWFFLYRIGYDIKDDLALWWRKVARWLRMRWRALKRKFSGITREEEGGGMGENKLTFTGGGIEPGVRGAENLTKQRMSAVILCGIDQGTIGVKCEFRQKDILASMKYQDMKVSRFSSQGLTMVDKMGKED